MSEISREIPDFLASQVAHLQFMSTLSISDSFEVSTELVDEDSKAVFDVLVRQRSGRIPDEVVLPIAFCVCLVCQILGHLALRALWQRVLMALSRSQSIKVVIDPRVPSAETRSVDDFVQTAEQFLLRRDVVCPVLKRVDLVSQVVRMRARIVWNDVV